MAIIHRISSDPENSSEAKAISYLANHLPPHFIIFHNFELLCGNGQGLPYEYDMCVVGDYAVYHVEVKNYHGHIWGNPNQWEFENGHTVPSPIPLANKKSKVLGGRLKSYRGSGGSPQSYPPPEPGYPPQNYYVNRHHPLDRIWVETIILLTDDNACIRIRDEQVYRKVIRLKHIAAHLMDPRRLSIRTPTLITPYLREEISRALFGGCQPRKRVTSIGVYDILERINQTNTRTVFLAKHKFVRTRPQTILKVFHMNPYVLCQEARELELEATFHDSEACRLLGAHSNLVDTSDMFAWEDNGCCFVLPTEYVEFGRPLEVLLTQYREARSGESPTQSPKSLQNYKCNGTGKSFYRKYSSDSTSSWGDDGDCGEGDHTNILWTDKLNWIIKIARGLQHAHSRGVVHRDLCPMNVVVAPSGIVKLVNFDYAKVKDSPLQCSKEELLSHLSKNYVAPEVWVDPWAADERSDVYSLGAIFYKLITGEPPPLLPVLHVGEEGTNLYNLAFRSNNGDKGEGSWVDWEVLANKLYGIMEEEEGFKKYPEDVAPVIDRMLRRNPNERYQSVGELIRDLDILDSEEECGKDKGRTALEPGKSLRNSALRVHFS